jgi:hypothetical protein
LPREVSDCLIFAIFKLRSDRNGGIFAGVIDCGNEKPKSRRFMEMFRRFSGDVQEIFRDFQEIFRDSGG